MSDGVFSVFLQPLIKNDKVLIQMGNYSEKNLKIRFNKLFIRFSISTLNYCGECIYRTLKKEQELVFCLMGPLASLVLSVMYFLFSQLVNNSLVYSLLIFGCITSFMTFLLTIIPIKYTKIFRSLNGSYSDGYRVLECIKR